MATMVHCIDVGQGNMVLVQCSDGTNYMVDCNIIENNKSRVLNYVAAQIGGLGRLRAFICTHRDADHMRGVRALHNSFSIGGIWDSGYPGTTTDTDEYKEYMRLRREVGSHEIQKGVTDVKGYTRLHFLSARDRRLPDNANDQGLVIKVDELDAMKTRVMASTILTGDGSYAVWKNGIIKDYPNAVSCDILMAAHHGSLDFFDDPSSSYYYEGHMKAIRPAMVVVSVGPNNYGHPDPKALELYRKHATGSNKGNKTHRTDTQGTAKLELKSGGGCTLT